MSSSRRRRLLRVVLRSLLIAVGAMVAMAAVGFALGGWAGARGGASWGLLAGALAIPGLLLGLVLHGGEDQSRQMMEEWGERHWGSGPRG
jgi:ABC-type dipeptide/oligopeptide/nickel transport system permease subunit